MPQRQPSLQVRIARMLAEKLRVVSWPQRGIQSTAMLAAQGPVGGGSDASGAAKMAKVLSAKFTMLIRLLLNLLC